MTTYKPLIKGFQNIHNLEIKDVVKDFIRVGDDSIRGQKQFKLLMGDDVPLPKHFDRCVCGHIIINNCFIANRKTNKVITLGKCCVKRFKGALNKRCDNCDKQHKNRSDNLCNECRLLKKCTRCLNYYKNYFYCNVCDSCVGELFLENQRKIIEKKEKEKKEKEQKEKKERIRKYLLRKEQQIKKIEELEKRDEEIEELNKLNDYKNKKKYDLIEREFKKFNERKNKKNNLKNV